MGNDAVNTIFQFLMQFREPIYSLLDIILQRQVLSIEKILIVGNDQNPFSPVHFFGNAKSLCSLQFLRRTRNKNGIVVGDQCEILVFIQLHGANIIDLHGIEQSKIRGGIVAFVKHKGRLGSFALTSRKLLIKAMKSLQYLWKLPGIIAIAFVNIVKERQVAIAAAEKRIADLAQIAASLLVFPALGDLTSDIEGVDKSVEVRAIIQ